MEKRDTAVASKQVENVTNPLAIIRDASSHEERLAAVEMAGEMVPHPDCDRPIPTFMSHLPWATQDDEVADRIALQVLAQDPDADDVEVSTFSTEDLVGDTITVHDIRVRPSTFEGGWGAYILADITRSTGTGRHMVWATGSKQIITKLAQQWMWGRLPVTGTVTAIVSGRKGRSDVYAFVVQRG